MLIGRMGVHDYIVQEENKREVADALNQLSLIDREILIRRYYYEQKPREISLAMNLSVKEINNHLYRSKQKLRKAVSLKGGLA
jgi:RNA polymerase sigma-70 factor (ECF subfamily)